MDAAGAGDVILDAGVPARDACWEGPLLVGLSTGIAARAVEATSSAAGCAMVA